MLDWAAYIPKPVPDEQNIFKAPKMTEWFVKPGWASISSAWATNELMKLFSHEPQSESTQRRDPESGLVAIAEVTIVPTGDHSTNHGAVSVLRFSDASSSEAVGKLIETAMGPTTLGAQYYTFIARPLDQIKPIRLVVQADKGLSLKDISDWLPTNAIASGLGRLQVTQATGSNIFRVGLNPSPVTAASAYLATSDHLKVQFELIREALKRPYARVDGNYEGPYAMPMPNFLAIRQVAQTCAQRAQCYLLLHQSEKAFRELFLIYNMRRLLEVKPTMLVSAMMDIAVTGLYVDTVADGMRLKAWREPELAALQHQLQQIDLPPQVLAAFNCERAATGSTFEFLTAGDIKKLYGFTNFRDMVKNRMFLLFAIAPRGWVYQNLITSDPLKKATIESFDPANRLIHPGKLESANREVDRIRSHWSPFTILAGGVLPNYSRAWQTLARNQTMANLGQIVCALERYRLAHGQYPEKLEALLPQLIEKIPHDIIGGQPLKYRRTDSGRFLLYSIGWNEKDDGGIETESKTGSPYLNSGDWVWRYPTR